MADANFGPSDPFGPANSSSPNPPKLPSSAMEWFGETESSVQAEEGGQYEEIDLGSYQYWLEHTHVPSSPRFQGHKPLGETLEQLAIALGDGAIAAIKTPWGFDLVCDATDGETIRRLRRAKGTPSPLAVMGLEGAIAQNGVQQYGPLRKGEWEALHRRGAPIVVVQPWSKAGTEGGVGDGVDNGVGDGATCTTTRVILPQMIAPVLGKAGPGTLGLMLPPTQLYRQLLEKLGRPLAITSGNGGGGVPGVENHRVRVQLGAIADYFLMNDQPVSHAVEASVVQVLSLPTVSPPGAQSPPEATPEVEHHLQVVRRSRGYGSTLIKLPPGFEALPPILAMGPTFDNTIALLRGHHAILSRHLGNLDTASGLQAYQNALNHHRHLWNFDPRLVAVETHPDYYPTKLGREWQQDAHPTVAVQHHHAHLAACLVDNQVPLTADPVLALVLDDGGYGNDGSLWGGELLWGSYGQVVRLGSLQPTQPPSRQTVRHHPWPLALTQSLGHPHPLTSSCGWLLGEVASRLGLTQGIQRHGPLQLEVLAREVLTEETVVAWGDRITVGLAMENSGLDGQPPQQYFSGDGLAYPFPIMAIAPPPQGNQTASSNTTAHPTQEDNTQSFPFFQLHTGAMWSALMGDLRHRRSRAMIAAKVHRGLAEALLQWVMRGRSQHLDAQGGTRQRPNTVALTGSVFQNRLLTQLLVPQLRRQGLSVLLHRDVPMGDGGVALGQGAIAAAQLLGRSQGPAKQG